ncbi:DNA polymerase subunit gamma-1 [Procambarus clarkii]|uniref:DNA polymerase subunit gamma-1 n=1 Tax=Procambarus clarkii TaxID=6728 RepID=UPI001E6778EA|nr:DNA polymerase subunit gamma-1-like [Procambarus clarkii]
MGRNIMAAVLQLRKFPCVRCVLCSPGIQANGWQCLSYVNLNYILHRYRSTCKKPTDNTNYPENKDTNTSEFSETNNCQLSFNSKDIGKSTMFNRENSVHKSHAEELKLLNSNSSLVKQQASEFVNTNKDEQSHVIGITSVKEVLKSLGEEVYTTDNTGREKVNYILPNESMKFVSEEKLYGVKEEISLGNKSRHKITLNRNKSYSNDNLTNKKKLIVLKSGKQDCKVILKAKKYSVSKKLNFPVTNSNDCSKSLELDAEATGTSKESEISFKVSEALKENCKVEETADTVERCKTLPVNEFPTRQHSLSYCKNILGVQTLSVCLANQIFSGVTPKGHQEAQEDFQRSKDHLQVHGLWNSEPSDLPDYDLELPMFEDKDLDQHFRIVAEEQCAPYKDLLNHLVGTDLPHLPSTWQLTPGWTRYNSDGSYSRVDFPDCRAIVFDVEVCVREGNHPVLATAASDKYWYSWCSNRLMNPHSTHSDNVSLEDLIPLESSCNLGSLDLKTRDVPRVVVGHNVSYDRIRVREQYMLEGSSLRFVDTMSLHISSSGLVSEQRALLMKNISSDKKVRLPWMLAGCRNSLAEVYKFYCNADLKKSTRDVFVKGSLNDVYSEFQSLMNYCANDVKATHMVLVKLLPIFFERFPHPVTLSGMLEMGLTFLPVTENWNKYIKAAETEFHHIEGMLNEELVKQVQAALGFMEDKKYKEDPWLWNLDWSVPKGRVKKLCGYPNWYRKLCARTGEREGTPEPENMSTSLQIVPKLLRLTWNGFPLHYERQYGWGYLKPLYRNIAEVPASDIPPLDSTTDSTIEFPVKAFYEIYSNRNSEIHNNIEQEEIEKCNLLETEEDWKLFFIENNPQSYKSKTVTKINVQKENLIDIGIPGVGFVSLPHKDGAKNRVGNPLAKDFLNKIEDKTLSSHFGDIAELVLKTNKILSYWKNNRDRILSQMVIWNDHSSLPPSITSADGFKQDGKYGAILPMVVVAGTITRRAVERTWMTASNAYADRIGSELKAMIEAPPGYKFVGADVDSQELWIAAVLGDAYFSGEHGATALGWMTLQGKKSDGTDMHSRTAKNAGISRDHAKIINYGRIYGAGLRFIKRLLKQFNPKLSEKEIDARAENLFAATKGQKGWFLNGKGEELAMEMDYPYTGEALCHKQINKLLWQARRNNIEVTFNDVVAKPFVWIGGSESHMFNCLEAIARCETPKTPVLGGRITRALEPHYVDNQFMTSRVNWVVQSSAVDYLHIMLVSMRWLFTKYEIKGRLCISIHDEVRYLVSSEDCYRAALALQITNLLTRSLFALRLGFKDLPQSVAFFSGVDIDQVLRKEPHHDCVTPSNPQGLKEGYGMPPGVTLDIQQILQITKGKLNKPEK